MGFQLKSYFNRLEALAPEVSKTLHIPLAYPQGQSGGTHSLELGLPPLVGRFKLQQSLICAIVLEDLHTWEAYYAGFNHDRS